MAGSQTTTVLGNEWTFDGTGVTRLPVFTLNASSESATFGITACLKVGGAGSHD